MASKKSARRGSGSSAKRGGGKGGSKSGARGGGKGGGSKGAAGGSRAAQAASLSRMSTTDIALDHMVGGMDTKADRAAAIKSNLGGTETLSDFLESADW